MLAVNKELHKLFSEGYVILRSDSSIELQRQVNKYINKGFTLVGGITVSDNMQRNGEYLQAVHKEPSKSPKSKATGDI